MARRIFVSYQDEDQLTPNGFDLMKYTEDLNLRFIGRHLLDRMKINDAAYSDRKIRQQIRGSSLTIIILGRKVGNSQWVAREIQWSLEKKPPNGLLGIRLNPEAKIPDRLYNCRVEILEWQRFEDVHEFQSAIRRAAAAAKRATYMPANSSATCARIAIPGPETVAPQSGRPSGAADGPQRGELLDAEEAIALAVDVAIDGWQQAAAERLADALGEEIWTAFTHRWRPGNCRVLAGIARELLELKAKSHDAIGELADWLADRLLEIFEPTIERQIACALVRALAKKVHLPTDDVLTESARTLRIIGIYVCVQFARDLANCQCLKDLAHDLFKNLAENLALQELKNILRNVESNVRPELTSYELEEVVRNVLTEIRPPRDSAEE